jgi:hypothetical protein
LKNPFDRAQFLLQLLLSLVACRLWLHGLTHLWQSIPRLAPHPHHRTPPPALG